MTTSELSQIIPPGTPLYVADMDEIEPSDTVVIYSRGRYRTAKVLRIGTKRVAAEYTTESGHTTRKAVPFAQVYTGLERGKRAAGIIRHPHGGTTAHRLEAE